jgi:hypothetical protein
MGKSQNGLFTFSCRLPLVGLGGMMGIKPQAVVFFGEHPCVLSRRIIKTNIKFHLQFFWRANHDLSQIIRRQAVEPFATTHWQGAHGA